MTESLHEHTQSYEGQTALGRPLSVNTAYKRAEFERTGEARIDTIAPLRALRSPYLLGCAVRSLAAIGMLAQGQYLTGALALLGFGVIGLPLSYLSSTGGPPLLLSRDGLAFQRSGRRQREPRWTLPWEGIDGVRLDSSRRPISLELNDHGVEALQGSGVRLRGTDFPLPRLAVPQLHEAAPWFAETRGAITGAAARLEDSARPPDAYASAEPSAIAGLGATDERASRQAQGRSTRDAWRSRLLRGGQVAIRTSRRSTVIGGLLALVMVAFCAGSAYVALGRDAPWGGPGTALVLAAIGFCFLVAALVLALRTLRPARIVVSREGVRMGRLMVAWPEIDRLALDHGTLVLVPTPSETATVLGRLGPIRRLRRLTNKTVAEEDGVLLPHHLDADVEVLRDWLSEVHREARGEG